MKIEPEIEEFISKLVAHLKHEAVFTTIEKDVKLGSQNWDNVARKKVGTAAKHIFKQSFPDEDVDKAVYVEEKGVRFELFLGGFDAEKSPYDLFGGLGTFPDIAIRMGTRKILIELDNSGAPRKGLNVSSLKLALAKAAFSYMTGEWDNCFVFFHNRSGRSMRPSLNREIERKALQKFLVQFNTELHLFEDSPTT